MLRVGIIIQEWCKYCTAFFSAKQMAIISRILMWSWCPATMKGQSHRFEMSNPSIITGIHKKECTGIWRRDECSLNEVTGVNSDYFK